MLLLPGAQIGPCLSFLGQACAEKFRWEKCQLNVGAEHCFKNALDLCVCVCVCVCVCECVRERERERESVIMQNTAYCSRNYFPRAAFCVHGDPHNAGCIQS